MEKQLKNAKHQYESHSVDMEAFKKRLNQKIQKAEREGLSRKGDGWTLKKIALVSAAVLAIGFSGSVAVSPTFASYISSLWTKKIDPGVQEAVNKGYAKLAKASVTDQGITIETSEVIADPARLIVAISMKNAQGEFIFPDPDIAANDNKLFVTDENGNVIADDIQSYYKEGDIGYFQFVLNDAVSKKMQLRMDVKRIRLSGNQYKEGSWKLTVPIDIEQSMAATTTVPLNQTYTTPQGITVAAKSIVYSPSATRLTFETSWTKAARERIERTAKSVGATAQERELLHHQSLVFRILDQNGKDMVKLDDLLVVSEGDSPAPTVYASQKIVKEGSTEKTIHEYVFFSGQTEKPLTFVLTGVSTFEPNDFRLALDPATLKTKPVSGTKGNHAVTVTDLSVQQNPATGQKEVALRMKEQSTNLRIWKWYLTDDKGQAYELVENRDGEGECSASKGSDGVYVEQCDNQYFAKGMTALPKKAALTIRLEPVQHSDSQWRVELPAATPAKK